MIFLEDLPALLTPFRFFVLCVGTGYLLSIITDGFLRLIDFAMDEGHAFSGWYTLILRLRPSYPRLFKVLGGCVVCSGFWLSLGFYALYLRLYTFPGTYPVLVAYQAFVVGRLVRRVRKQQRREALAGTSEGPEVLFG